MREPEANKHSLNECSARLVEVRTVVTDRLLGRLHTIVPDASGNLYFSDEVNHRVLSLDRDGRTRWAQGEKGTVPGEFLYPRGLSLGRIRLDGKSMECLAVADSWNHRIQFLGLNGNPLHMWTSTGSTPFSEPTDVRFIQGEGGEDFWLVLDRESHRLHRIDRNGDPISQIGQAFPPGLENRWAVPELLFSGDAPLRDFPIGAPAFDFLYFPERILGESMKALFISEPLYGKLKQVVPPHLLPVTLEPGAEIEYISADDTGLLCWNRRESRLIRYDRGGRALACAEISGLPVASSAGEIWVHDSDRLRLYGLEAAETQANERHAPTETLLSRVASLHRARADFGEIREAIEFCFEAAECETDLAGRIASIAWKGDDGKKLKEEEDQYVFLQLKRCNALLRLRKALHPWCLGSLEKLLSGEERPITDDQALAMNLAKSLLEQLQRKISDSFRRYEEWLQQLQNGQVTSPESAIPLEKRVHAILGARNDTLDVQLWIGLCLGKSRQEELCALFP